LQVFGSLESWRVLGVRTTRKEAAWNAEYYDHVAAAADNGDDDDDDDDVVCDLLFVCPMQCIALDRV